MKKIPLLLLCFAMSGCYGRKAHADCRDCEICSLQKKVSQEWIDSCATSERCYWDGRKLFENGETEKAMLYFKQSIRLGSVPQFDPRRDVLVRADNMSEAALSMHCHSFMKTEDYYGALGCWLLLAQDGTGVYISEIIEKLGISQSDYYNNKEVKDAQDKFVLELWGK
ncbi:MAG: hypothetical protein LBH41_01440 [Rickettsiales bacterium]|jgi:hypothetical protein|nr:hypothetical protein [Rickettsiales bacterium]